MRRSYLPPSFLPAWAKLNGATLNGVHFSASDKSRGLGIFATAAADVVDSDLIRVPADLVLSLDRVWAHARIDPALRAMLEANGDFAKTARGAVMIFLLVQISASSPDVHGKIGIASPWTEYVQCIHTETSLPTLWTEAELSTLRGTSLGHHVAAKLRALEREFAAFEEATADLDACRPWWEGDQRCLTNDDWKAVDSIWRSRAMDFEEHGLCLVPLLDMANHAGPAAYKASYHIDPRTGDARLALELGKTVMPNEEVTIMYGSYRGAADFIFSYGFMEVDLPDAQSLFLSMEAPDDDPLALAKVKALDLKPGCKLYTKQTSAEISWSSPFVWVMCLNEEDGLAIRVAQTVAGFRELQLTWKGREMRDYPTLERALRSDDLHVLFQLRGYALVLERITLEITNRQDIPMEINEGTLRTELANKLRELEDTLLNHARRQFDAKIVMLYNNGTVTQWFREQEERAAQSPGTQLEPTTVEQPQSFSWTADDVPADAKPPAGASGSPIKLHETSETRQKSQDSSASLPVDDSGDEDFS